MDDSKGVSATLVSDNVLGRFRLNGSLTVRCFKRKVDIIVDWGQFLGDNTFVRTRFDEENPEGESWRKASSGGTALFYYFDKRGFLDRLMRAQRLILEATPYDAPKTAAIFTVAGSTLALAPVLNQCSKK